MWLNENGRVQANALLGHFIPVRIPAERIFLRRDFFIGGGGGNRTRVHNRYPTNVYMLSVLLI